nr:DUF2586 domain-containing protein [Flavobacterium covae]
MNGITFKRQGGGLKRQLPGEDHISGLLIYGAPNVGKTTIIEPDQLDGMGITAVSNPVVHYHISEYFRINPGSKVYLQSIEAADDQFVAVKQLQQFAEGKIKQLGIVDLNTSFVNFTNSLNAINACVLELANMNMPLSVMYSIHNISNANLLALPVLHNLNCERISVCIGQDGAGRGNYVSQVAGKKVGIVGAALGAISRAKVHESIGWVAKQNLVTDIYPKALTGNAILARELDVPMLIDGTLLGDLTPAQIQSINDKGYLFPIKHIGYAGTYMNDSFTCSALDNDYAYIENNRTIDKAMRGVYVKLLPSVSGPIYIDPSSGNIAPDAIASLEAIASIPLEQMQRDGEISGFKIFINPDQDVLTSSKLPGYN